MADQLWFIPATGGGSFSVTPTGTGPLNRPADLNVQYGFGRYPTQQQNISPTAPILAVETRTEFDNAEGASSLEPGKLLNCFARFIWDSCACDPEHEDEITLGGQLNVGTVFARLLPKENATSPSSVSRWGTVEVWVKFRVDVPDRLDQIYISIGDKSGNVQSTPDDEIIGAIPTNDWFVGYFSYIGSDEDPDWNGWDSQNLRSTISFLGTSDVANIGRVNIDIEWFAFRLSNES